MSNLKLFIYLFYVLYFDCANKNLYKLNQKPFVLLFFLKEIIRKLMVKLDSYFIFY